jgi:hypothetical protein
MDDIIIRVANLEGLRLLVLNSSAESTGSKPLSRGWMAKSFSCRSELG